MSKDKRHIKEVYLVRWKQQKNHVEIFDRLDTFAASYPVYDLPTLTHALAFGNTVFEDADVCIEKKAIISAPKPDLPRRFFWEFNYDKIDWQANADTIVQRVLERGSAKHWQELIRYYGKENIVTSLKETIAFLPDECIGEASLFFNMNKEDMLCYKRKQLQQIPWL